jgi:hypothetical protein
MCRFDYKGLAGHELNYGQATAGNTDARALDRVGSNNWGGYFEPSPSRAVRHLEHPTHFFDDAGKHAHTCITGQAPILQAGGALAAAANAFDEVFA